MAKGNNSLTGRRSSLHNSKPYDANNSFVRKVATKVTDLIPQKSWISKWFNSSPGSGDVLDASENNDGIECEEDIEQPPPLKRPRIRMDVTHPPGTFSIQPRTKSSLNQVDDSQEEYSITDDVHEDLVESLTAESSSRGHLVSSTPAIQPEIRSMVPQGSELNSLVGGSNNGATNGMDDNSESSESTSGCSSLIPQTNRQEAPTNVSYTPPFSNRKKFMDDKLSFTNHLQSPRSLFLHNSSRDSLSSRRPSFNASVMTNTLDRASPLSSPFYSGNTTFGGASAVGLYKRGRNMLNSSSEPQLKVPRRTSIEVKPSNEAGIDSSGMSQTAKKILEALEHFSSPITDAKKIPVKRTNNSLVSSSSKKRSREEMSPTAKVGLRHLTRELVVPTVPDILKLRRRQKLQDTTVAARKIVSARSKPPPSFTPEYQLRTPNEEDSKHYGKLKTKSKIKFEKEKMPDPVNLPNIPLPISSLPSFNFTVPNDRNKSDQPDRKKEDGYTFASPIKLTTVTKILKSINNFTFSSPLNAESQKSLNDSSDAQSSTRTTSVTPKQSSTHNYVPPVYENFIWTAPPSGLKLKKKAKTVEKPREDSYEFKSGSVMDVLGKPINADSKKTIESEGKPLVEIKENLSGNTSNKIMSQELTHGSTVSGATTFGNQEKATLLNVWECSECLIKNNDSELQCVACKACKPTGKTEINEPPPAKILDESKTLTNKDNFMLRFKRSENQWECKSCYVINKDSDVKCVACNSENPKSKRESQGKIIQTGACDSVKLNSPNTSKMDIKEKESPVESASNSEQKNVAPTVNVEFKSLTSNINITPKKLKSNSDLWECPCCMVRNAAEVDMCPCCNTRNPNSNKTPVKKTQLSATNGFGDQFKKPEGAWICDACMVSNKPEVTECIACTTPKPGTKKVESTTSNTGSNLKFSFGIPSSSSSFKFGLDKTEEQKSTAELSTNGFKFGSTQVSSQPAQFTFGIPEAGKKTDNTVKSASGASTITESRTSNADVSSEGNISEKLSVSENAKNVETKASPMFSFSSLNEKSKSSMVTFPPQSAPSFSFRMNETDTKTTVSNLEKQESSSASSTLDLKPSATVAESTTVINTTTLSTPTIGSSLSDIKESSGFTFGALKSPTSATNVQSSTTAASTLSLPSVTQSFVFNQPKTPASTTTVSTSEQVPVTTASSKLSAPFTFGETKRIESTANTTDKNTVALPASGSTSLFSNMTNPPVFGSTDGKAPPPVFGSEHQKQQPVFGSTASKSAAFAAPENKVSPFKGTESKPSLFGTSEAKLPVFGSVDKPASAFNPTSQVPTTAASSSFSSPATIKPLFESSAPPPSFDFTSSNIFSTTKSGDTATSNTSLFTFGTTPSQPATQSSQLSESRGGFNFSANSTYTPPKPLFTFGSTGSNPPAPTSNLFSGGAMFNNPTSSNSSGFAFNVQKPEASSTFGQASGTGVLPFGGAQNTTQNQPAGTFSGLSSNTPVNFNSGTLIAPATPFGTAPPPAPSEGFKFNLPPGTPSFNPHTRPSFNFTGGSANLTFNAPTSTFPPSRKYKVAVRRKR